MVFSSLTFLFLFLPISLIIYYLLPKKFMNLWLFIVSIIFYSCGGFWYAILFLTEIIWNWIFGILIGNSKNKKVKMFLFITCITFDISILVFFKYIDSLINVAGGFFNSTLSKLVLPIGISFYTFQELSYIIDVYRGEKAQKNIINLGLYLAFFPQLIAGPIVRYDDICTQIKNRTKNISNIPDGFFRFCIGLSKKVLIANQLGYFADYIFSIHDVASISAPLLWLGAIAFALQIYYDFSGYSDMAIGLGLMFGFKIKENFKDPYLAKGATDFWRRWHISLSSWFRDYLYIPLGGSKNGSFIMVRNLLIVWILTGMWHGSKLNFIVWGLLWGVFIIIEKILIHPEKRNAFFGKFYRFFTLMMILLLWVIFRADSLEYAVLFIERMFSINAWLDTVSQLSVIKMLFNDLWVYLVIGLIFAFCSSFIKEISLKNNFLKMCTIIIIFVATIFSISFIINESYNPFLYFQF